MEIQHRYAQINGIRMHYAQAGEGERLIVLLHGFPECWYSWRHQIPALATRGTVVAPDLRGYGETEKPAWGYELDALVRDVEGLIAACGRQRAVVVGHDWGGALAWSLAIARPQLVERLAVMNVGHPGVFSPRTIGLRQRLRSWYILFFQLPLLPELALRQDGFRFVEDALRGDMRDQSHLTDEDVRVLRQAIARPGALRSALAYYRRAIWHSGGIFRGTGLRVSAPTLLIWGEEDRYQGRELAAPTARFVPDLRLRLLPGVSHWVQQEAPELVNTLLLDFLDEEIPWLS